MNGHTASIKKAAPEPGAGIFSEKRWMISSRRGIARRGPTAPHPGPSIRCPMQLVHLPFSNLCGTVKRYEKTDERIRLSRLHAVSAREISMGLPALFEPAPETPVLRCSSSGRRCAPRDESLRPPKAPAWSGRVPPARKPARRTAQRSAPPPGGSKTGGSAYCGASG